MQATENSISDEHDNYGSNVRADLRSSFKKSQRFWVKLYVVFAAYGCMLVLAAIAIAAIRSEFRIAYLLPIPVGILVFWCGVQMLEIRRGVTIRWDCCNCGKRLESNVEWTCGSCDRDNKGLSFLEKCAHCEAIPKAFECYHCGKSTFLLFGTSDERTRARKKTEPRPGETIEEAQARELSERKHEIKRLELDLELAKLKSKLKPRPAETDPGQKRTAQFWQRFENAVLDCKTIQAAALKEKELHAEIDANPDLDDDLKKRLKHVVTLKFEGIQIELDDNMMM